jgi:hypothetical protein
MLNRSPSAVTKYPVKQRLRSRIFSATASLVALAAWLTASNHCALGGLVPKQVEASAHSHCSGAVPEAPADEEKGGECDGSKCCKSLSAPTLAFAKSLVTFDTALFATTDYLTTALPSLGALHDDPICELDTGPPERSSFAESVLQRSILAHAPPVSA